MAALDHPCNGIVAPVTDGPLELQEDLCRCEHRRPLPADQGEDSRLQPPSGTVQRILVGVPLEGGEVSRPRAAACVPDIHDRRHRSVTDQDIAGVEIGMDHVRCLSWWRDAGAYLPKPAWTEIVRHTMAKGTASPDDPALAGYWAQRRRKVKPPLDSYTAHLLTRQDGQCSLCGENLITPDQPPQTPQGWEHWFLRVTKKAIEADHLVHHDTPSAARSKRTHLVHATCSRANIRPGQRGAPSCSRRPEPPERLAWAACAGNAHAWS